MALCPLVGVYSRSMIKLKVKEVAKSQGIKNSYALEQFLKVSHSVGSRLWAGRPIPRLKTLEMCALKFGCRIEDLYESTLLGSSGQNGHNNLHKNTRKRGR